MRGLALGDLHLGFESRFGIPTDVLIQYLASLIKKHAIAKGIRHVFFMGDVFDEANPSQEVQAAFNDLLHQFRDSGLTFYVLGGNHCKSGAAHSLTLLSQSARHGERPYLRVFKEPAVVHIEGVPVNFLPWPHSKGLSNCLNMAHILKVGCVTETGFRITDGLRYAPIDRHHWIIGDNHTHQIIHNTHWVGTPYQTKFSESYDAKIIAFEAKMETSLSVRYNIIPVTPPYKLETHVVRSLPQARRLLRALHETPRLFYTLKFDLKEGHESAAALAWPDTVIERSFVSRPVTSAVQKSEEPSSGSDADTVIAAVRNHLIGRKQAPWIVSRAVQTLRDYL